MENLPPDFHRRHGLQFPWDNRQVFTWVLVALSCVFFFTLHFPILERKDSLFWTILYLFTYICGIILFVFATLCEHTLPPPASPDHRRFCRWCKEFVPESAKHCRLCNKCRMGFDHHCRFVNNCVTISNYQSFFYGLLFLISAFLIALIHVIYVAIIYSANKDAILNRISSYLHIRISSLALWILMGASAILQFGLICPLIVLVVFHVYFQKVNISTFHHLMNNYSETTPQLHFCCGKKQRVYGNNS